MGGEEVYIYICQYSIDLLEHNKQLLKQITNFLTGDNWEFTFRERNLTLEEKNCREQMAQRRINTLDPNKICMFSGGLDSFIGAIDLLEDESKNIIL